MQKKRNVNSVLMKQKFIKKPKEEMPKSTKYMKKNKPIDKNNSQPLPLTFDIIDLSVSENNKSTKPKKIDNQKLALTERLNKLKIEYESALQTKRKLEAEVYSAKAKASKAFQQTSDSAELNTNIQILKQKLSKTQTRYKTNLKLLEQMRSKLDDYRTARYTILSARKKEKSRPTTPQEPQSPNESFKKDSNPIINELNQRSNELFKKTDEYQSILVNVIDLTGMNNINEVFYEAERIERENKNIDNYLAKNEPLLPKMIERRDELKKICDELTIQRQKEAEAQNDILHDMSIDFSNIQIHLSEIETQKKNDENSFSDVFFEIEQIYEILGCDFDDIANDDANKSDKNYDTEYEIHSYEADETQSNEAIDNESNEAEEEEEADDSEIEEDDEQNETQNSEIQNNDEYQTDGNKTAKIIINSDNNNENTSNISIKGENNYNNIDSNDESVSNENEKENVNNNSINNENANNNNIEKNKENDNNNNIEKNKENDNENANNIIFNNEPNNSHNENDDEGANNVSIKYEDNYENNKNKNESTIDDIINISENDIEKANNINKSNENDDDDDINNENDNENTNNASINNDNENNSNENNNENTNDTLNLNENKNASNDNQQNKTDDNTNYASNGNTSDTENNDSEDSLDAKCSKNLRIGEISPKVNFNFRNITPRFKSLQEFETLRDKYSENEEEEEESNEPFIRINQTNVLHALSIIELAVRKLVEKNEKQTNLSDENDSDQRIESDVLLAS